MNWNEQNWTETGGRGSCFLFFFFWTEPKWTEMNLNKWNELKWTELNWNGRESCFLFFLEVLGFFIDRGSVLLFLTKHNVPATVSAFFLFSFSFFCFLEESETHRSFFAKSSVSSCLFYEVSWASEPRVSLLFNPFPSQIKISLLCHEKKLRSFMFLVSFLQGKLHYSVIA